MTGRIHSFTARAVRECVQIKYTPLHAAVAAGKVGCIVLMVEAGALVDEQVGQEEQQGKARVQASRDARPTLLCPAPWLQVARAINARLTHQEAGAVWSIGTAPDSHGSAPGVQGGKPVVQTSEGSLQVRPLVAGPQAGKEAQQAGRVEREAR